MTRLEGAWLTDRATRTVMQALEAEGGADCARFVGGCVRNGLLDLAVDDIDIATRLVPERVLAALSEAGIRAVPTGLEHGTVTALAGGRPFEITTLRRDVSTDGRRAVVAFSTDWAEDAARRDFGLNALYADRDGRVFDPTGQGLADLAARRVVFVGDPAGRIAEDYLRILRFFRFHAWYGRGEPDPAGLAACAAMADGLTQLSAERIAKEIMKLLAADDPLPALKSMVDTGILRQVLDTAQLSPRAQAMVAVTRDPLLRLAALLPLDAQATDAAARRLRLSNAQRQRLVAATGLIDLDMSDAQARSGLYRLGAQTFADRLAQTIADQTVAARGTGGRAAELDALARSWQPPVPPFDGAAVMAAGMAEGPQTGRVLRALTDWWIDADFPHDGWQAELDRLVEAQP